MIASTSRRKCTECEASLPTTPSLSAVSYEEISPIPAMERSSSHRTSKNIPVLRGSRVNNTSQKAAERPVRRKQLPVDKRSDGYVGASGNGNEYCKLCGGF
jgi:hypothetical protein